MKFAHFSDTHLGFRQYGLYERELDFYRAFEKTVARIIEERPDFVLHSGDLFDVPKPPPRALWVAQRCFARLREKDIPVYAITGNHDMLMRKGAMPPQILYRDMGVRLLTEDEPFVSHNDVFIGGVPYFSRHYSGVLKESLDMLSRKAAKYRRSIVMIHQGTDRHIPKAFELEMKDIPKGFNYYAMGHVHARIMEEYGKGFLVYPGSTELWSVSELDDYRRKGKGFTLVDIGGDVPDIQNISIELERPILREKVNAGNIDAKVLIMKKGMEKSSKKPLVYLDVRDKGFERSALHEMLTKKLSGSVLSMRINYIAETEKGKIELSRSFDLPQIHSIMKDMLKDNGKSDLASALFRSLSEGNDEQALKEAESFFKGMEEKT